MKRSDFYGLMVISVAVSSCFGIWQHNAMAALWMFMLCLLAVNLRTVNPFSEPWK